MTNSPYHDAEKRLHALTGKTDLANMLGKRVVNEVTQEAAALLPSLSFLVCSTIDAEGWPWASLLCGEPGFIAFDQRTLTIALMPNGSERLVGNLSRIPDIGLLGIDLERRRRYRINGRAIVQEGLLHVAIEQCYRNCPQYINGRAGQYVQGLAEKVVRSKTFEKLCGRAREIVAATDTFFIATHGSGFSGGDHRLGADVSHRGGNPGFVAVDAEGGQISIPDYTGNYMFNTLGNLTAYPSCGLLFIDFSSGESVQIAGSASVDWDVHRALTLPGAQRFLDIKVRQVTLNSDAVPMAWGDVDPASDLRRFRVSGAIGFETAPDTGPYERVGGFRRVVVRAIVDESDTMKSFHLRPVDGALDPFEPGQHIQVKIRNREIGREIVRSYSLSNFRNRPDEYRICVRRAGHDMTSGSHVLHTTITEGAELLIAPPGGKFVLDQAHERPVAMVSIGVGITPMMAMLEAIIASQAGRDVWFIHGARNSREHAFGSEVRRIAAGFANVRSHFRYSAPLPLDVMGRDHDSVGRIDAEAILSMIPQSSDIYLCGTSDFMRDIRDGLVEGGIPDARIFHESFGSAGTAARVNLGHAGSKVKFIGEALEATWTEEDFSILELAERGGLSPANSCRNGECGICEHKLISGEVRYPLELAYLPSAGHVLICCAQPISDVVVDAIA
ncbi:pyridoxamine 5'-phosphate oxidase family protein [Roseixanthobacter pseudopolyaromaticivorans]|uniref:pyridoxamine 5'-phosphate oxidase family protein n=1 Tax=Xanthobacteraceae TaxID=335928 RepID=UPI00372A468A